VVALKQQFELFKDFEIMDAWAFWPLKDGGLGLKNPLVDLIALKQVADYKGTEPSTLYEDLPKQDFLNWNHLCEEQKQKLEKEMNAGENVDDISCLKSKVKLISFEEYCSRRETHSRIWKERFDHLMSKPSPVPPMSSPYEHGLPSFGQGVSMYNQWLFALYSAQIQDTFGTFQFINTKLIPASMISDIMNSKLRF